MIVGKVHPFGDGIFENKYLFVFQKDIFFKAVKLGERVSNDIVFAREKVDVRVKLFNIVEPLNYAVRSGVVSVNVEVIGMDV